MGVKAELAVTYTCCEFEFMRRRVSTAVPTISASSLYYDFESYPKKTFSVHLFSGFLE
jgi:hypothetical protein